MKYLKTLGLGLMVAMALMAFAGAGTASASVLCTTATNPCTSPYANGTIVEGTLEKESTATFRSTEASIVGTCTGSSIGGSLTNGSSTVTAKVSVGTSNLTWSGCTDTTDTITPGELEIHATTSGNGTVTARAITVTLHFAGLSCPYTAGTGVNLGTYTELTKTINVNTVVNLDSRHGGGFLCPSDMVWEAKYVITKPSGTVYVSAS
jgi:hypothetical protein